MKTITKFTYAVFGALTLAIGAVTANGAVNDLFVSINGNGSNGGGSVYEYTPAGFQSTFATGLSRPRGVAFDSSGNLLVATSTFDNVNQVWVGTIVKIIPDGVHSTFASLGNYFLEGVALDQLGNVFVIADNIASPGVTIFKITPDGVPGTFASLTASRVLGSPSTERDFSMQRKISTRQHRRFGNSHRTAPRAFSQQRLHQILILVTWLLIASATCSYLRATGWASP